MARQRPFNPEPLVDLASPEIQPPLGVGALVWRYTVLVPLEESKVGEESIPIADMDDIENLGAALSEHFGGVTVLLPLVGLGLRELNKPETLEANRHLPFMVYARPIAAADKYFERLQQELQEALGQGLVLVERQEAFLIGAYLTATLQKLPGSGSTPLPGPGGGASRLVES